MRSGSGVGRSDVGGGAGGPGLATVAVLAAGPLLLLRGDGRNKSSNFTVHAPKSLKTVKNFANENLAI